MNAGKMTRTLFIHDNKSSMQKRILSNLLIVSICGIILSTTVFFSIQTVIAQKSADKLAISKLNDVEERILLNS